MTAMQDVHWVSVILELLSRYKPVLASPIEHNTLISSYANKYMYLNTAQRDKTCKQKYTAI